jgi:hypothetical protein
MDSAPEPPYWVIFVDLAHRSAGDLVVDATAIMIGDSKLKPVYLQGRWRLLKHELMAMGFQFLGIQWDPDMKGADRKIGKGERVRGLLEGADRLHELQAIGFMPK